MTLTTDLYTNLKFAPRFKSAVCTKLEISIHLSYSTKSVARDGPHAVAIPRSA